MYKWGMEWCSDFWHEGKRFTKSWGAISKTVAGEKDRKFRTEVLEGKYSLKARRILFEKFAEKHLEYPRVNKKLQAARRNESSIEKRAMRFRLLPLPALNLFESFPGTDDSVFGSRPFL